MSVTRELLLASPRSLCAGEARAIRTAAIVLDRHCPPVYVRKQIVHDTRVIDRFTRPRSAEGTRPDALCDHSRVLRTRGVSGDADQGSSPSAEPGGRHLPSAEQGAFRGETFCRARVHDRVDLSRRARAGGGHSRRRPQISRCDNKEISPNLRHSTVFASQVAHLTLCRDSVGFACRLCRKIGFATNCFTRHRGISTQLSKNVYPGV